MSIVSFLRALKRSRAGVAERRSVLEHTARLAPEWGIVEVRRPLDGTNVGPFMGSPTQ